EWQAANAAHPENKPQVRSRACLPFSSFRLNVADGLRHHQFNAYKACDLEPERNKKASLNVNGGLTQAFPAMRPDPTSDCQPVVGNPHPIPSPALISRGSKSKSRRINALPAPLILRFIRQAIYPQNPQSDSRRPSWHVPHADLMTGVGESGCYSRPCSRSQRCLRWQPMSRI